MMSQTQYPLRPRDFGLTVPQGYQNPLARTGLEVFFMLGYCLESASWNLIIVIDVSFYLLSKIGEVCFVFSMIANL